MPSAVAVEPLDANPYPAPQLATDVSVKAAIEWAKWSEKLTVPRLLLATAAQWIALASANLASYLDGINTLYTDSGDMAAQDVIDEYVRVTGLEGPGPYQGRKAPTGPPVPSAQLPDLSDASRLLGEWKTWINDNVWARIRDWFLPEIP